ncbi:MAG: cyanophycinase [Bacteroidales bacterium]|jgi:cyanophycinase|nr:cyanophycinase [Bacteroidales bacterium]
MKKILPKELLLSVCALLVLASCVTKPAEHEKYYLTEGPANGSLIIAGGSLRDTSVVNRFISLAGGKDALIVFIPTSSGAERFDTARTVSLLTSAGARNVRLLHTYDPAVANTEEFASILREAGGVFFGGGRQWRFVDAYGGTLTEREIRAVLARGGVIGGSSAGATIQGSFLARGDTRGNNIMIGDHIEGFGYLTNSAIDQHLLVRNRQHDLVEVIEQNPHLLGIGIDENTAVLIQGNRMEVMGESFVAIYDQNLWHNNPGDSLYIPNGGKFYLLRRGDIFDVKERNVIRWVGGNTRNIFSAQSTTDDF